MAFLSSRDNCHFRLAPSTPSKSMPLHRQNMRWCGVVPSRKRKINHTLILILLLLLLLLLLLFIIIIIIVIIVIIFTTIIIIIIISFMQGIYTYIPETNYVPRKHSVSAILSLLFMVSISLVPALALLYFYYYYYYY